MSSRLPPLSRQQQIRSQYEKKVDKLSFFKRYGPMLLFLACFVLLLFSIMGHYIQLFVEWVYPPEMWKEETIVSKANEGIWKWITNETYFDPREIGVLSFIYVTLLSITTWLISSIVNLLKHLTIRYLVFSLCVFNVLFHWIIWAGIEARTMFEPWITEIMQSFISDRQDLNDFLIQNISYFTKAILVLPLSAVWLTISWYIGVILEYWENWNPWFAEFKFEHYWMKRFRDWQRKGAYPDVIIGIYANAWGKVRAILRGFDRATHTLIVGSIGSGKTAAMILPLLRWDMKHLIDYINNYFTDDPKTKEQRLCGMAIIDPSNDLASKTHKLARAHGIPEEAIFYLDPSNPNTKSFNPLRGPAETVAATFVYVIEGLQPDQEDFYKNSQAIHLYYHILLLKLFHEYRDAVKSLIRTQNDSFYSFEQLFETEECTLDVLMEMYTDPWLVYQMGKSLELILPKDWKKLFKDNKEEFSRYSIIHLIIVYIKDTYRLKTDFKGENYIPYPADHPHAGEIEVTNSEREFIKGLKNILSQFSSNTMFRRVMFGDSGLDLDSLMRTGGILIVNTSDGEMGRLSYYFGSIMIQSLVAATYRRDISKGQPSGFHVIIDEFPKYAYENYYDFPSNSRKYGAFVTIAMQSIAQLALKFGEDYLETIIGVHRNRMVYAGVPKKDAEYFSKYFGKVKKWQVAESTSYTPSTQNAPGLSIGERYSEVEEDLFTVTDISESKAFHAVLQLNEEKNQGKAKLVKADFVPAEEFINSDKKPIPEMAKAWVKLIEADAKESVTAKPISLDLYSSSEPSGLVVQEAPLEQPIDHPTKKVAALRNTLKKLSTIQDESNQVNMDLTIPDVHEDIVTLPKQYEDSTLSQPQEDIKDFSLKMQKELSIHVPHETHREIPMDPPTPMHDKKESPLPNQVTDLKSNQIPSDIHEHQENQQQNNPSNINLSKEMVIQSETQQSTGPTISQVQEALQKRINRNSASQAYQQEMKQISRIRKTRVVVNPLEKRERERSWEEKERLREERAQTPNLPTKEVLKENVTVEEVQHEMEPLVTLTSETEIISKKIPSEEQTFNLEIPKMLEQMETVEAPIQVQNAINNIRNRLKK